MSPFYTSHSTLTLISDSGKKVIEKGESRSQPDGHIPCSPWLVTAIWLPRLVGTAPRLPRFPPPARLPRPPRLTHRVWGGGAGSSTLLRAAAAPRPFARRAPSSWGKLSGSVTDKRPGRPSASLPSVKVSGWGGSKGTR